MTLMFSVSPQGNSAECGAKLKANTMSDQYTRKVQLHDQQGWTPPTSRDHNENIKLSEAKAALERQKAAEAAKKTNY